MKNIDPVKFALNAVGLNADKIHVTNAEGRTCKDADGKIHLVKNGNMWVTNSTEKFAKRWGYISRMGCVTEMIAGSQSVIAFIEPLDTLYRASRWGEMGRG